MAFHKVRFLDDIAHGTPGPEHPSANFMTVNEKRHAVGLDPIKGGDILAQDGGR